MLRSETEQLDLVGVRQLAASLGVSLQYVRRMARTGKLPPPVRVGGAYAWDRAAVAHLLREDAGKSRSPEVEAA